MRIWLLNIGEALPIDPGKQRQLRMSLLADALVARGHDVTYWSSDFDHNTKKHRTAGLAPITIRPGYTLRLLHGPAYPKNISLQRFANHAAIGLDFHRRSASVPKPDVVMCTVPTVELAYAGVRFARRNGIPVIVDVRDLWPDIIIDLLPRLARPIARAALSPLFAMTRRALAGASAITGVSPSYVQWGLDYAKRSRSSRDAVFPLGYPRAKQSETDRAEHAKTLGALGVDPSKKIALFVGMFGRTYDLATVIKAARSLETTNPEIQFVFVGTGDFDEKWRTQAAGLRNVVFTGWQGDGAIKYLLSVAWVGLASYAAGAPQSLPNKVFEYMSTGLPQLSTLRGDAEQLFAEHDCGLTYAAGDSDALVDMIAELARNPSRHAQLSANSKKLYESEYEAEAVYAHFVDYLERAAGWGEKVAR